jgi:hypothetical protein
MKKENIISYFYNNYQFVLRIIRYLLFGSLFLTFFYFILSSPVGFNINTIVQFVFLLIGFYSSVYIHKTLERNIKNRILTKIKHFKSDYYSILNEIDSGEISKHDGYIHAMRFWKRDRMNMPMFLFIKVDFTEDNLVVTDWKMIYSIDLEIDLDNIEGNYGIHYLGRRFVDVFKEQTIDDVVANGYIYNNHSLAAGINEKYAQRKKY